MLRHRQCENLFLLLLLPHSPKAPAPTQPSHISPPLSRFLKHLLGNPAPISNSVPRADPSLTLHFLRHSCGLSSAAASAAAARVHLKSTKNAHAVLALLRGLGLATPDLARLVAAYPEVLAASASRTLAPKIHFYCRELGLADGDFCRIFLRSPRMLLAYSVERRLRPNYQLLKNLLHTDANVRAAVKQSIRIIYADLHTVLLPKIALLREHGVLDAVLVTLVTNHPRALVHTASRFEESLEAMRELGIRPSAGLFAYAFGLFARIPEPKWRRRMENFVSLGWSKEQVLRAFVRHPYCMSVSDEKVRSMMAFFAGKLNWSPQYVSASPVVLSLSYEKRIAPRCVVLEMLASRGLVKRGIRMSHLMMPEKKFMEKYVVSYQEAIPEVLEAYGAAMARVVK